MEMELDLLLLSQVTQLPYKAGYGLYISYIRARKIWDSRKDGDGVRMNENMNMNNRDGHVKGG